MTQTRLRQEDLALGPDGVLEIDLQRGATLRLVGGDGESLQAFLKGGEPNLDLEISTTSDGARVRLPSVAGSSTSSGLIVEIRGPRHLLAKIRSTGGDLSAVGLEGRLEGTLGAGKVSLHNLSGSVDLRTGAGAVELEGCSLAGRIETQAGRIRVREGRPSAPGSGELRLSSGAGNIDVAGTGQGLNLNTACGNIRVTGIPGPLQAATGGGDVVVDEVHASTGLSAARGRAEVKRVDPAAGTMKLEMDSVNGGIDVSLPGDLEMKIDVRLSKTQGRWLRPKIRSDFDLPEAQEKGWTDQEGTPRDYRRMTAVFGDGKHQIKLRAVDGNVRIRRSK